MLTGPTFDKLITLNLGGMANVTWVPRRGAIAGAVAFDTGPGVAVLDAVRVLTRNGPQGGNVADARDMNIVAASTDQVPIDEGPQRGV